jgi:hypothetical protein
MSITEKTQLTNPLDTLFNTPPIPMEEDYDQITEGELAELQAPTSSPEIDEEDAEIDGKIDAVYDSAMEAFQSQTAMVEILEPRYAARNAEVAATYLNIALNAATSRARVKGDRKKTAAFIPYSGNGPNPNNVVVASREEILRMISVDAEVQEFKK